MQNEKEKKKKEKLGNILNTVKCIGQTQKYMIDSSLISSCSVSFFNWYFWSHGTSAQTEEALHINPLGHAKRLHSIGGECQRNNNKIEL